MVQMSKVSIKVPNMATVPWRTGSWVLAAAWAMAALPNPDSLENTPPRNTPLQGSSDGRASKAAGSGRAVKGTINDQSKGAWHIGNIDEEDGQRAADDKARPSPATMRSATAAMLLMPPMITAKVRMARPMPVHNVGMPRFS